MDRVHLLFYIIWNSSVRKSCFISIYLLVQLFVYTNMDSWIVIFILWVKIQYYYYLFHRPNCFSFSHWELFQLVPALSIFFQALLFWHDSLSLSLSLCLSLSLSLFLYIYFLSTSLLSGTTRCSRLILHFPCPSPSISHFPKEPVFPSLESGIEKPRPGCWVCSLLLRVGVDVVASGPSQLIASLFKKKYWGKIHMKSNWPF